MLNNLKLITQNGLPRLLSGGEERTISARFFVAPFDADPLRQGFYVEVKWRNRYPGATDDAMTALLLNIEAWYDLPTIVLYDGQGAIGDVFATVKYQLAKKKRSLDGKLLAVMTFNEFVLWAQTQLGQQERVAA